MESDLGGLANRLHLTEEEEAVVIVSADHTKSSEERSWLCLVGRILTHRPVNAEAFRSTMAAFNHIVDKKRVLARGPWNFDKQLVLLEELDGSLQPSEVQFRFVLFWVHVFDLPIIGMTREVGALIGNSIGTFADMDYAEGGVAWGKSLRIRVAINIHKPLRRGMKITLGQKDPVWVSFKYERLPNFCFACGILGHNQRECDLKLIGQHVPGDSEVQYGGVVGSVQNLVDFRKASSLSGLQSKEGHSPKQDVVGMSTAVVVCGGILGVHAKTKRNWKRLARKGSGEEVVKQVSDRKRKGEITSSRPMVDGSELAKKMKSNLAVGLREASWQLMRRLASMSDVP
ncbi:Uncharacterized protein LOK49_LG13G02902 [Camellia lanceoleosa]|uniref:Uncharacterized protein n=1 Tax=Camellia lanceoleosa TaxID=1840588 RepID=A0ACC0FL22_9ERIC|nr:Uncharacterized protein LOK49_LG13G02902 [Camellia lanceoleosa]